MNLNGVLNICKEKGYTSHDVVAKLRGICHQKKIGHTGTLDPMATGVLPVCFGNATKLCDFLSDRMKTYRAVMLLGKTSDTYDVTGVMSTIMKDADVMRIEETAVREAVLSFVPGYEQIPPMYSAKKVDGKKLYELARKGVEIERKAVRVELPSIELNEIRMPHVTFTVTCSKGTYIRSLIHDIGQKLTCGAVMEDLVRTASGGFVIEDALPLSEIEKMAHSGTGFPGHFGEEMLASHMVATDAALSMYPAVRAKAEADKALLNGNLFPTSMVDITHMQDGQICRVYRAGGDFVGLFTYEAKDGRFRPYKMFL